MAEEVYDQEKDDPRDGIPLTRERFMATPWERLAYITVALTVLGLLASYAFYQFREQDYKRQFRYDCVAAGGVWGNETCWPKERLNG